MTKGRPRMAYIVLLLLLSSTYLAEPICDVDSYGKPDSSDCTRLFDKITQDATSQARFFDEEQLRADANFSWPGLSNLFGVPIVQVPKYYAMSQWNFRMQMAQANKTNADTCNFALMPYTNPLTRSVQPMAISSWTSVRSSGHQLIKGCLDKQGDGGEVFVTSRMNTFSCDGSLRLLFTSKNLNADYQFFVAETSEDPVLVMFMWASGARFEAKLNQYENDPTYSPQLSLSAISIDEKNNSLVSIGNTDNGTMVIPTASATSLGVEAARGSGSTKSS